MRPVGVLALLCGVLAAACSVVENNGVTLPTPEPPFVPSSARVSASHSTSIEFEGAKFNVFQYSAKGNQERVLSQYAKQYAPPAWELSKGSGYVCWTHANTQNFVTTVGLFFGESSEYTAASVNSHSSRCGWKPPL